ncbi:MAG: hypothetical protein ABH803_01330 [Candidatus Micrarchaeota archaeon]
MKTNLILCFLALTVTFGSIFYWNTASTEDLFFEPPYYFIKGSDPLSVINAFFFVFLISLLFFGTIAPLAWAIEGLKYGSLLSIHRIASFDVLFIIPQFLATYSAILFGIALNNDLQSKENFFNHWHKAILSLLAGLILLGVLIVLKSLVSLPF